MLLSHFIISFFDLFATRKRKIKRKRKRRRKRREREREEKEKRKRNRKFLGTVWRKSQRLARGSRHIGCVISDATFLHEMERAERGEGWREEEEKKRGRGEKRTPRKGDT